MRILKSLSVSSVLLLAGCATASVGSGEAKIPADAPHKCAQDCAEVGMQLAGMVTMADNVGCVCEPRGPATSSISRNVAAFGGTTAVLAQRAAYKRRQQQQQQQQQRRR